MPFCAECGMKMAADAQFCVECGASLKGEVASAASAPPPPLRTAPTPAPLSAPSVPIQNPPAPALPTITVGRVPASVPGPPTRSPGGYRMMGLAMVALLGIALIGFGLSDGLPGFLSPSPSGNQAATSTPALPSQPAVPTPAVSVPEPVSQPPSETPPPVELPPPVETPVDVAPPVEGPPPAEDPPGVEIPEEIDIPGIEFIPLFEVRGDLNGDGSPETVKVLPRKAGVKANSNGKKEIVIAASDGTVQYRTPEFTEPFRTDMDDIAQNPGQKVGLHILKGQTRYPLIRVIFVPRSGNFIDLQYDGTTYDVVATGN